MITFVNAKINIGLRITGRRADGYHNLETIFYPIGIGNGGADFPYPFGDIIEAIDAAEDTFQTIGLSSGCEDRENIVVKAQELFKRELIEKSGNPGQFQLILEKHLPNGAGLGGGSADASFALKMLNTLNGEPFRIEELEKMALKLGADCPVFIQNRAAYGEGIGEILTPIDLDLSNYVALIVKPEVSISTREAFENVKITNEGESLLEMIRRPITQWQGRIKNSFEDSLFPRYPELEEIRDRMLEMGAIYSSMSGSGSAIYGIFQSEELALESKNQFEKYSSFIASLRQN